MELQLKHLAPYLPYGLQIWDIENKNTYPLVVYNNTVTYKAGLNIDEVISRKAKPILHPLSDLTKEIEHNGEKFIPSDELYNCYGQTIATKEYKHLVTPITLESYILIRQLFEWHFDVFNLIPNNLAIDINTLK